MAAPFKEYTLHRGDALPQMTRGRLLVSTPLCVLNVSALKRAHLTAYCIELAS